MKRKAPSREWRNEVRKKWSDNPPVPASSILENYQQPACDGGLEGGTQLTGGGYKEIKICIS